PGNRADRRGAGRVPRRRCRRLHRRGPLPRLPGSAGGGGRGGERAAPRGPQGGTGFPAATPAGNAVAVPTAVAAADPRFLPFVPSAAAQTATAVLVTPILGPLVAPWVPTAPGAP